MGQRMSLPRPGDDPIVIRIEIWMLLGNPMSKWQAWLDELADRGYTVTPIDSHGELYLVANNQPESDDEPDPESI